LGSWRGAQKLVLIFETFIDYRKLEGIKRKRGGTGGRGLGELKS
jgi:hypothetical protein